MRYQSEMGGKDVNYQVVYRGEILDPFKDGGWVFFQRSIESGGGFWFGRTYTDCFWFEFERPTSLAAGLGYLMTLHSVQGSKFDDDFTLT